MLLHYVARCVKQTIPFIQVLICETAKCWQGISWPHPDDKTILEHERSNHALDPIPALSQSSTVTQLSDVNLMNQQREGDITHTHTHAQTTQHKQGGQDKLVRRCRSPANCQARWFTDEELWLISSRPRVPPAPINPLTHRGFNPWGA